MNSVFIYFYSLLTIIVFVISIKISQRFNAPIFNPFIIGLALLITTLLIFRIPYQQYYEGNGLLNNLLGVSVVSLALPFYEQFAQIRKQWKSILIIVSLSTFLAMASGALLAILFGGTKTIIASILPKSVSTPIAIAISKEIGGESAVSVIGVTIAGITGSAFGITVLKWCRIHHPQAVGLSMGAVSHALGTARCMEIDRQIGSYSSIALVMCGVLSSLLAPLMFKLISWWLAMA